MRRATLILALVCVTPALASADEPSVTLEAPLEATLGDPIPVLLTVTTDPNTDAAVADAALEPFEVLGKDVTVTLSPDKTTRTFNFELTLQCFEVGQHTLGPMRVRLASQNGDLAYLDTGTKTIDVLSVLANEPNAELKPPTQPVSVEQDDYTLLVVLSALLAVLLGAVGAWLFMRWWNRRDRPEPAAPPPPPPWESALAELRALETRRSEEISEGRTEQWVDAVSDSIRNYLGRRFGFHGLESTTDEIIQALGEVAGHDMEPEVLGFLSQCDLVKFARASLADEASHDLISEAIALVDRTRPTPTSTQGVAS
ncbi:MAG: hypothetical protein AAF500_15835 [Myxococcota bacterium]